MELPLPVEAVAVAHHLVMYADALSVALLAPPSRIDVAVAWMQSREEEEEEK